MYKYYFCRFINCILYTIFLGILLSLSACARRTIEEKQIIVIFRYDDYCERSLTDFEVKLIDAFKYYKATCTFGVIPYVGSIDLEDPLLHGMTPLGSTKASILKTAMEAGVLDVALHGCSHQTISPRPGFTEFSGLDYGTQLKKIEKAQGHLEEMLGRTISTFIPPWNSYDLSTLRALEKLGFRSISANLFGPSSESTSLMFLPTTCSLLQLQEAVKSARRVPEIQPVIVVLFHSYDFLDINPKYGVLTYRKFLGLLDWVTSQKDVRIKTISQATEDISDLRSHRFKINQLVLNISEGLIPPWARHTITPPTAYVYVSSDTLFELLLRIISLYLTGLIASAFIVFLVSRKLFPKSEMIASIFRRAVLVILVILLISVFIGFKLDYLWATIITLAIGICIGILWPSASLKKQGRLI